ncbi:hypothetical protein [Novosphingobium terrae]|uniref:hypothetical protein n=1 Tax=Novosphingobium terrae TaxID=2726189 RepID=UPI00197D19AF|nr:hypothetical protein [Novosphingobium terrae]
MTTNVQPPITVGLTMLAGLIMALIGDGLWDDLGNGLIVLALIRAGRSWFDRQHGAR